VEHVWYFAYGSNMDPARLISARLNPGGAECYERVLGRLDGWRLVFDKPSAYFVGAGAANLSKEPHCHALGTLNRISASGLAILDHYENVADGQYERITVSVIRPDTATTIDAFCYVARRNLDDNLKPRSAYMAHLLAGADLLPLPYVTMLKNISVCTERFIDNV